MDEMERLDVPGQVSASIYKDVTNGQELRNLLVEASRAPDNDEGNLMRHKVDFAFIDAAHISSSRHLMTGIMQALVAKETGSARANTLHSEVLVQLDPGNKITDAIAHFGVSAKTSWLIIVRIGDYIPEPTVAGTKVSLKSLDDSNLDRVNWSALRKIYKLNNDPVVKTATPSDMPSIVDSLCTSLVALRQIA